MSSDAIALGVIPGGGGRHDSMAPGRFFAGNARIAAQNRILTAAKAAIKMARDKKWDWDDQEDQSSRGEINSDEGFRK